MTTEYLITYALIFGAVFSLIIFVSTLSKNRNLSQYKNLPIYFYMFQGAITFFSLEIGSMLVKSSSKNKLKMEKKNAFWKDVCILSTRKKNGL